MGTAPMGAAGRAAILPDRCGLQDPAGGRNTALPDATMQRRKRGSGIETMRSSPLAPRNLTGGTLVVMAFLGAVFLYGPSSASAAGLLSVTSAPAVEPARTEGPEVIPATDIPSRADADERFVQQVLLRARQKDPTRELLP